MKIQKEVLNPQEIPNQLEDDTYRHNRKALYQITMSEGHLFYTFQEALGASLATNYSKQKQQQLLMGQAQSGLIKPARNQYVKIWFLIFFFLERNQF